LQIGEVLMWAGIPQLFLIPFVPKLIKLLDSRLIIGVGVIVFSISCFMNSDLTNLSGIDQLRWSQLVKAMGQPLIMVPLSAVATAGLPKSQAGSASGLFNMMRNLGGSFGIAALATLLTQREKFHSNRLGDAISLYNSETQQRVDTLTQMFVSKGADFNTAQSQAFQAIASTVSRESYVMAFNDCFYFVGFALLLSGVAVLFFKKVRVSDTSSGGH
jgi:DHA2 family multidrug resistance protein